MAEEQLWVVTDSDNHWLWYGRGTSAEAHEQAMLAEHFNPKATLYFFAISAEIITLPGEPV